MPDKILVLGKSGQVGGALAKLLGERALLADREEADFLSAGFIPKLDAWVGDASLAAVINAAAYTQVDKAEGEGREAAFRINGSAVGELAAWCARRRLPLVHYSTDYVFDGGGDAPWKESDAPAPLNAYGESKLAGERAIREAGGDYFIFRTSWVYDAQAKNFFTTMLRLLHEREEVSVVADQTGAPTFAPHLAQATLAALEYALTPPPAGGQGGIVTDAAFAARSPFDPPASGGKMRWGLYHLCAGGETSWHGFAENIFALARRHGSGIRCREVNPIPTSAYPLPARRPLNSRLDCSLARDRLGVALPHWEAGLEECFNDAVSRLPDRRPEDRSA